MRRPAGALKWRPIKSAPRDGTLVQLAEPVAGGDGWNVMMGRWVEGFPQYPQPSGYRLGDDFTSGWIVSYAAIYPPSGNHPASWVSKNIFFSPSHWQPMAKPPRRRIA